MATKSMLLSQNCHFALLNFILVTLSLANTHATKANQTLTLNLIHRYSPQSPLYSQNLNTTEMMREIIDISDNHVSEITSIVMNMSHPMHYRPVVRHERWMYMVELSIGEPAKTIHLQLDTMRDLVWLQCFPCVRSFPQNPPVYNSDQSRDFHPHNCIDPECQGLPCVNNMCEFTEQHSGGTYAKGVLARDFITMPTSGRLQNPHLHATFGCARDVSPNMYPHTRALAGSFGLGYGKRSFMKQIKHYARGWFSYCLVPMEFHGLSALRFGNDVSKPTRFQVTPILKDPQYPSRYLVELQDISIEKRRLNLPPVTFARHPDGSGGCYFDIGVGPAYLPDPAYHIVTSAIDQYLLRYKLVRVPGLSQLEFCYRKRVGFAAFPLVTFHFKGANMSPRYESLFHVVGDDPLVVCLLVKRAQMALIGAVTQQNYKVMFDINLGRVYWEERDCTRGI